MKKVLIINTIGLNFEGITSVIYNYLCYIDKKELRIDVLAFEGMNEELKAKFENKCNLRFVHKRKKHPLKYIYDLNEILRMGYDVVHINGNSSTMALETVLCRAHRVKKVIAHCHNTTCNHQTANKLLRPLMLCGIDERLACSKEAGDWLFRNNYTVLNNAIDSTRFQFDLEERDKIRKELNLEGYNVIGHIGHFTEQKNHSFLIDVFYKVYHTKPSTRLLLVSDGPEFVRIKEKVHSLNLDQAVIFLGRRSDAERIYQAMDLFVLPSLWEGLGIVLLEAQANGLPCFASSKVPSVVNISEKVKFLSLERIDDWVQAIVEQFECSGYLREENSLTNIRMLKESGYDITCEADKLANIYL